MPGLSDLWKRFKKGSRWINLMRETYKYGVNAELESEIKRFEDEVITPLEAAWAALPAADKEAFWQKEVKR
jgi:hypothetical protein